VKRVLDTNAYVAFRRGDAAVGELVRSSERLYLSVFVLGELYFGFHDGARRKENASALRALLAHPRVSLELATQLTAERFGRVSAALKRAGTPIPTNDVWIAAHTLELGAELVTYDRHFRHVPGLVVVDPAEG